MEGSQTFECGICGYKYSEADGDQATGIAPGTRWPDVPADWRCPYCGADKESFTPVE